MRIAFAAEGEQVSSHFGHCGEYVLVDLADGKVARQARVMAPPHAPCVLPPFLHQHGAECVVAGGMGPRAMELFEGLGIRVMLGVDGPIAEAVEKLAAGALEGGEGTCGHPGATCSSSDCSCHSRS